MKRTLKAGLRAIAPLRRRAPVILMYHRVLELEEDPLGLAVHPERFREQMEILARTGRVAPLAEIAAGGVREGIAVTFDDGYADNAHNAAPVLERYEIAATFFITTGMIGGHRRFWWDVLQSAVYDDAPRSATYLDVEIQGRRVHGPLDTKSSRRVVFQDLLQALRLLPPGEIYEHVREIQQRWGNSRSGTSDRDRPMTQKELRGLSSNRLFEIGCHSVNHPALAQMSVEMQEAEIRGSKDQLFQALGVEASSFAYPFGGVDAVDRTTAEIVADAGFARACTTQSGRILQRTNTLMLPRHEVNDWNGPEFEENINLWLEGSL